MNPVRKIPNAQPNSAVASKRSAAASNDTYNTEIIAACWPPTATYHPAKKTSSAELLWELSPSAKEKFVSVKKAAISNQKIRYVEDPVICLMLAKDISVGWVAYMLRFI